jgi:hypothetical protein
VADHVTEYLHDSTKQRDVMNVVQSQLNTMTSNIKSIIQPKNEKPIKKDTGKTKMPRLTPLTFSSNLVIYNTGYADRLMTGSDWEKQHKFRAKYEAMKKKDDYDLKIYDFIGCEIVCIRHKSKVELLPGVDVVYKDWMMEYDDFYNSVMVKFTFADSAQKLEIQHIEYGLRCLRALGYCRMFTMGAKNLVDKDWGGDSQDSGMYCGRINYCDEYVTVDVDSGSG